MKAFGERVTAAIAEKRSAVCVGLDPRPALLPSDCLEAGHASSPREEEALAEASRIFCRRVVQLVAPHCAAVKPQVAFFEVFGSAGMEAYLDVCAFARGKGLPVIADIKRGDIGTTAEAYARAWLARRGEEAPRADACTINPYLGRDGVIPFLEAASGSGGGVFVLVRTSNPSAADFQDLRVDGETLYLRVARLVRSLNEGRVGPSGYGPLGAVVGATRPEMLGLLRAELPTSILLLPGFGAQGAGPADVVDGFDENGNGCLVSASRSITFPWSGESVVPRTWEERIVDAVTKMRDDLLAVLSAGA